MGRPHLSKSPPVPAFTFVLVFIPDLLFYLLAQYLTNFQCSSVNSSTPSVLPAFTFVLVFMVWFLSRLEHPNGAAHGARLHLRLGLHGVKYPWPGLFLSSGSPPAFTFVLVFIARSLSSWTLHRGCLTHRAPVPRRTFVGPLGV